MDTDWKKEVVEATARTAFILTWASAAEEAGESFSGCKLEDVAPRRTRGASMNGRKTP